MSMDFLIIECDRCKAGGNSTAAWGRFEYETPGGRMSINREIAWCQTCERVEPVERLPTLDRIQAAEARLDKERALVALAKSDARTASPVWKRMLGVRPKLTGEMLNLEYSCGYQEDSLKDERQALAAMSGRKSPPRCLTCGGDQISRFPKELKLADLDERPRPPEFTGLLHSNCGGRFLYRISGFRVSKIMPHRIYDLEGRFLREGEGSEG